MAKSAKKSAAVQYCEVDIEGIPVPFALYAEHRYSSRISIGKAEVHLRYPKGVFDYTKEKALEWGKAWVAEQFRKKPGLKLRFSPKTYKTGDTLNVCGQQYTLLVESTNSNRCSARLKDQVILLKVGNELGPSEKTGLIRTVLSRLMAKHHLPAVSERVEAINQHYFRKPIDSVRLKYNHSNWGSCSTKGIINLSTRLLLAPQVILDYVIVHELAHLVEMNHSPRFWKVVEKVMPEYGKCEKWLSKQGANLDF